MKQDIPKLIRFVSEIDWEWKRDALDKLLLSKGFGFLESFESRISYTLSEGHTIDIYCHEQSVLCAEITLDIVYDTEKLSEEQYNKLIEEYLSKSKVIADEIKTILGDHVFIGLWGDEDDFPNDQDALWLALWNIRNIARLMVELKQEDNGLPLRICIVIAPFLFLW